MCNEQMDVMCHETGLIGPECELAVCFALSECGGQISGGFCRTLYNTHKPQCQTLVMSDICLSKHKEVTDVLSCPAESY